MEQASAEPPPFPRALVVGHVVLATAMCTWRAIESTPGLASEGGGTFAESTFGRALAFASILAGVTALVVVCVLTSKRWRDWRALLLLVSLGAAMGKRREVDVLDLVYVALVAILAAHALVQRRSPDPARTESTSSSDGVTRPRQFQS